MGDLPETAPKDAGFRTSTGFPAGNNGVSPDNAVLPMVLSLPCLPVSSGQTGGMNSLRIFVKGLAVVVGLFGASLAAGSLMVLAYFAYGTLSTGVPKAGQDLIIGYLALVALFGGLGYYFLRTAWKHLRRPELNTATNVAGAACATLGFWLLALVSRSMGGAKSTDPKDVTNGLAIQLAVIVACYMLHRLLLKRLVARAYSAPVSNT